MKHKKSAIERASDMQHVGDTYLCVVAKQFALCLEQCDEEMGRCGVVRSGPQLVSKGVKDLRVLRKVSTAPTRLR
jgi:hypothetical protein